MASGILLNKPFAVLSQFTSGAGRPCLRDYVQVRGVYPAGRLDADSEGLLVLTGDGALQARVAEPRRKMAKTYWAQVEGLPSAGALQALCRKHGRDVSTEPRPAALLRATAQFQPFVQNNFIGMFMNKLVCALISTVFATANASALAQQPGLPVITLNAGIHLIHAEVAETEATREQGLMLRKALAQGAGMVFRFDEAARHCMWMKNTLIPLSVAFIDERGQVVNIADMQPLDETSRCASRPARYALEMNQGWFKKRGIVAGALIQGLDRLSPAAR